MANVFDQFDEGGSPPETPSGNVFDQFETGVQPVEEPPVPSPGVNFSELFDQYRSGNMSPKKMVAFEELLKRRMPQIFHDQKFAPVAETPSDVFVEGVEELPASSVRVGQDLVKAFMSPIETIKGIGQLGGGLLEKLQTDPNYEDSGDEEKFDQFIGAIKNRYGSAEGFAEAWKEDPAEVAMDFAGLITGTSSLLKRVPGAEKMAGALDDVGRTIDPHQLPLEASTTAAGKTTGTGKKLVEETVGMTTGAKSPAVSTAMKGDKLTTEGGGFTGAMRGEVSPESIVTAVQDSLKEVRRQRGANYREQLDKIRNAPGEADPKYAKLLEGKEIPARVDINPVYQKLKKKLEDYEVTKNEDGTLDFSRSDIQKKAWGDAQEIVDLLSEWGRKPGDFSPKRVDTLKRQLDEFYSESNNLNAFVADIRSTVKKQLDEQVPGYKEMTKDYELMTEFITEAEKAFSTGKKSSMDTTMRKLIATGKENFEFRRQLLGELEKISGRPLGDEIAGLAMSTGAPRGFVSRIVGLGGAAAGASGMSPALIALAATTSPRLMGELLNLLGFGGKQTKKAINVLKDSGAFDQKIRQAGAIGGRTLEEEEGDK